VIYFSSDSHYFHRNIITYTNRPFKDIEHMNEALIQNWNSVVKPEDEIWVLGDFSFGKPDKTAEIVKRLNGYKRLVLGNHDKKSHLWGFDEVITGNTSTKIGDTSVLLSHYPYPPRPEENSDQYDVRYLDRRYEDRGAWLLHGHSHGNNGKMKRKMIDVGVDCWNYTPISIDFIQELMAKYPEGFKE